MMEREEEKDTHTHTTQTVSGTQSVEGSPPYLKTSSLGRKIRAGPLFIDEKSHTPNTQQPYILSLHFTKPTGNV